MLDIIVTHYKEPWNVGEKFFTMLDLQRGVRFSEFQVILVNDGAENELSEEHFQNRPYAVRQISIPHSGVSASRNAGLKAATDEWVMFCDFDDMFSNVYSIRNIIEMLPAKDYDMLWAHLIVEDLLEGHDNIYIAPDNQYLVFIHGKIYRRSFLIENNLMFDEELRYNEDSAFNAFFAATADYKRIGELKTFSPPYVWCRRENSTTTKANAIDEARWGHFRRNLKVCEIEKKNRTIDFVCGMVTRTAYDTYYMLNTSDISDGMKEKIKKAFKPFWIENKKYYGSVSNDISKKIQDVSFEELHDGKHPVFATSEMVNKWLDSIDHEITNDCGE